MQDAEPSYLAPEEIESPRVTLTPARDVFVLASIAFELITGQRAFPGITRQEVTRQILSPVRPRPAVQGRALPGALDVVLMRAWSLWPNARFSSAGEFANEFSRVLGSVPRTSSGTRPAVNLSALDPRRRVDTPPSSFTRAAPVSRPVSLEAPPAPTQLRFDPPSPGTMRIPIPPRTATPSQRPVATALPFKVPAPSAPVVAPLAPKLAPSGPIAARVPTLQPRPAAPPPPPPSALGVRTTPKASPPPPPPASRVKK
jgi:hypothetical protein